MESKETLAKMGAILCTLAEVVPNGEPVPASSIYLALGMNMMEYTSIIKMLVNTGYVSSTPSTIRITPKGKEIADRINTKMVEQGVHPEKLVR